MKLRTLPIFLAFLAMGFGDAVGPFVGLARDEFQLSNAVAAMVCARAQPPSLLRWWRNRRAPDERYRSGSVRSRRNDSLFRASSAASSSAAFGLALTPSVEDGVRVAGEEDAGQEHVGVHDHLHLRPLTSAMALAMSGRLRPARRA